MRVQMIERSQCAARFFTHQCKVRALPEQLLLSPWELSAFLGFGKLYAAGFKFGNPGIFLPQKQSTRDSCPGPNAFLLSRRAAE